MKNRYQKYKYLLCEHVGKRVLKTPLHEAVKVANRLVEGAPTAIRWTHYALNKWLRVMGPTFDASVRLGFLGFAGSEVREGLASHLEKRPPQFQPARPI
jgi:enoyl-CoA hydratase